MPNVSTVYGIRDTSVYEALIAARAQPFMKAVNRNGPDRSLPTVLVTNFSPDYQLLALGSVTHVLLPTADAEPLGANSHLVFQAESDAGDQPLDPIKAHEAVSQSFIAPTDGLSAIGFFLVKEPDADGTLQLSLTDETQTEVARATAELRDQPAQGWLVFPFDPIPRSAGATFTATLEFQPSATNSSTIRLVGNPAAAVRGSQLQRNGQPTGGNLRFRLYRSTASAGVQPVWTDDEFTLFKVVDARPRAYIASGTLYAPDGPGALAALDQLHVPGLDAVIEGSTTPSNGGDTHLLWDNPGDVALVANTSSPGIVVLSESYADGGWGVEVDGRPAPLLRANYLFQGVAVEPGEHTVRFRYWPQSLSIGIAVSALAAILVVGLLVPHLTLGFSRAKKRG
jgi:hypothetical protein